MCRLGEDGEFVYDRRPPGMRDPKLPDFSLQVLERLQYARDNFNTVFSGFAGARESHPLSDGGESFLFIFFVFFVRVSGQPDEKNNAMLEKPRITIMPAMP